MGLSQGETADDADSPRDNRDDKKCAKLDATSYCATPQRLRCLTNIVDGRIESLMSIFNDGGTTSVADWEKGKEFFESIEDIIRFGYECDVPLHAELFGVNRAYRETRGVYKEQQEMAARMLGELFVHANKKSVKTDQKFALFILTHLVQQIIRRSKYASEVMP